MKKTRSKKSRDTVPLIRQSHEMNIFFEGFKFSSVLSRYALMVSKAVEQLFVMFNEITY